MFFLIIATILETIADVLFKKQFFWIGMSAYIAGTIVWAKYLADSETTLSTAVILFAMINLVAVSLAGVILFKEEVTTKLLIALAFALLAIFFAK